MCELPRARFNHICKRPDRLELLLSEQQTRTVGLGQGEEYVSAMRARSLNNVRSQRVEHKRLQQRSKRTNDADGEINPRASHHVLGNALHSLPSLPGNALHSLTSLPVKPTV